MMSKTDMAQIRPKLWIGSQEAAAATKELARLRISHIVSVGAEFPEKLGVAALGSAEACQRRAVEFRSTDRRQYLREGGKADPFVRLLVAVEDQSSADLLQHLDECRVFVKEGLMQGGGVLVHCWEGKSRSAAVVASYLMQKERLSVAAALLSIKEHRPEANPSKFIDQLCTLESRLGITPASPRTAAKAGALKKSERAAANPQSFIEVAIDGENAGRVVIELLADIAPRTADNFRALCTGERGRGASGKRLNYLGSLFHRMIPGVGCVGGDITEGDGTGGESIYGFTFDDENFEAKHDGPGVVSMANSGLDTNGSQFLICTAAAPHLDGKNVVFGRVVSGFEVVERVQECAGEDGTATKRISIVDCGEVTQAGRKVKRARAGGGADAVIRVLQILRKHAGCKKATSWREGKIACSREEAAELVVGFRAELLLLEGEARQQRFQEIAREHSDCKSAKMGGDLGPAERGLLHKAVEEAAFALELGELSAVVSDSRHGEHLLLRIS